MAGRNAGRDDLILLECVHEMIVQRHRYKPTSPYRRRIHNELRRTIGQLRVAQARLNRIVAAFRGTAWKE